MLLHGRVFKTDITYPVNTTMQGRRRKNCTLLYLIPKVLIPQNMGQTQMNNLKPIKELSFWDINVPHLHDYFVFKQGQFKLLITKLY